MNQASGRFASVAGGSQNFAKGRFSLAAGYYASAAHMNSASLSFTGKTQTACETQWDNEFAMCADKVTINGQELFPELSRGRALAEASEGAAAVEAEATGKKLAELRALVGSQEKALEAREKLIAELQHAVRLLDGSNSNGAKALTAE